MSKNFLTSPTLQEFGTPRGFGKLLFEQKNKQRSQESVELQKGGVPATPSGTATLLRLSPSRWFNPKQLL
jgi:hypothetical protein